MAKKSVQGRPPMAPDSELREMMARGLRLWRGEWHDGPTTDDMVTDSAGYRWIKKSW